MAHMTIVAQVWAKAEAVERVREVLMGMVKPSRAEAGCVNYDLHEDIEQAGHFVFHENWADRAAFEAHKATGHYQALGPALEGLVERTELCELERIG